MKKWQRVWLYFLVGYALLHLIRDVQQDLGIKTILSTLLVKKSSNPLATTILWSALNTYFIAAIEIVLASISLKLGKFGKIGWFTIVIAGITLVAWCTYWFFL